MGFWSGAFLGAGVALVLEHLYVHGNLFSIPPYTDHGIYGIALIVVGLLLVGRRRR
jgi:hypothetical protein